MMKTREKTRKILKGVIIMNVILVITFMMCYLTSNKKRTYITLERRRENDESH